MFLTSLAAITVDDVVLPDGRTLMGQLGGAGPYAVAGMALVAPATLACPVGDDWFDRVAAAAAGAARVDGRVSRVAGGVPTPRAWQIYEEDQSRRMLWRTPYSDLARFRVPPAALEMGARRSCVGIHVLCRPERLAEVRRALERFGQDHDERGVLIWEPMPDACRADGVEAIRAALQDKDLRSAWDVVLSPNELEAGQLLGPGQSPAELARGLLELGAPVVALRCGARGCVVGSAEAPDKLIRCPARATDVRDPTGGGNAFCGAFVAALLRFGRDDLARAGCCGNIAGGLAVSAPGVPLAGLDDAEFSARVDQLLRATEPV